jgi:hypothetical protein
MLVESFIELVQNAPVVIGKKLLVRGGRGIRRDPLREKDNELFAAKPAPLYIDAQKFTGPRRCPRVATLNSMAVARAIANLRAPVTAVDARGDVGEMSVPALSCRTALG